MQRLSRLSYAAISILLIFIGGLSIQACWVGWGGPDDDDTSLVDDDDTSADDDDSSASDDDDTSAPACSDDTFEENDSIPTAASIAPGDIAPLTACPDDDDFFSVSVQPGFMMTVRATFAHAAGDIDITITDPEGQEFLGESADNNEEASTQASTGSGIFTIKVFLYDEEDAVPGNSYSLSITTEPYLGDDDDAGDDDDTAGCVGPSNVSATVSLTDSSQNPTTFLSVADPLTINVSVAHNSGSDWTSPYLSNCLFHYQLINPLYPGFSQTLGRSGCVIGDRQCTDPDPATPCQLECGAAPFTDTFSLIPTGWATDSLGNYSPLPSGAYELLVELDPVSWNTDIANQTFNVVIREGALEGECNDGNDNDLDSLTDCADVDCAGKDGCP